MSPPIEPNSPKLLDCVREVIRIKHYSYRTEETHIFWIRRYILFHDKRHPKDMNSAEIEVFLSHLAGGENDAFRMESVNVKTPILPALFPLLPTLSLCVSPG